MDTAEARKEARLAATRARRGSWGATPDIETTVGDIRVGDFLVEVPECRGIKGYRVGTTVTRVDVDWSIIRTRGSKVPVEARRLWLNAAGKGIVTTLTYQADAPCTIRRAGA